jgi:hypothetical protein
MWQADLPPANAPAVMFSQDGPYAVGDPDTSYRYWPNQAGRLELIRRNLDGTGPGIGTNFTIRGRAAPCPADFNADGTTDFLDYADFVTCFEGSDCPAGRTSDFNADGTTDFFDYSDFVAAFEAGC